MLSYVKVEWGGNKGCQYLGSVRQGATSPQDVTFVRFTTLNIRQMIFLAQCACSLVNVL